MGVKGLTFVLKILPVASSVKYGLAVSWPAAAGCH